MCFIVQFPMISISNIYHAIEFTFEPTSWKIYVFKRQKSMRLHKQ